MVEEKKTEEMTDDEAILKIASAMKDNTSVKDEKYNVHIFLNNVATSKDPTRTANLRDDEKLNELGVPKNSVRGLKEMALISEKIMANTFFKEYYLAKARDILETSLSREGFLIRQAVTQTKQVADITKRRKINKGWFGKQKVEEQGGDTIVTTN